MLPAQIRFVLLLSFSLLHFSVSAQYRESQVVLHGRVVDLVTKEAVPYCRIEIRGRVIDILPKGMLSMRSTRVTADLNLKATSDSNGEYVLSVPTKADARVNWYLVSCIQAAFNDFTHTMVYLDRSVDSVRFDISMVQDNPTPGYQERLDMLMEHQKAELERAKALDPVLPEASPTKDDAPQRDKQGGGGQPKAGGSCTWTIPSQVFVQDLYDGYNNTTCTNPGTNYTGMIDFDDYIAGVVQGEMGAFPLEAKKAQAVAARSYSQDKHEAGNPVNCGQAYDPAPSSTSNTAATSTTEQILMYNGSSVIAHYAARCNGNYTQHSEAGTWNPSANCNLTGSFVAWERSRPCSGHSNCNSTTELPCCQVTISTAGTSGFIYGHGVGLCQRGAQGFANAGDDYCDILNAFYTNICIANSSCGGGGSLANDDCPGTTLTSTTLCTYLSNQTVNNAAASGLAKGTCDVFGAPDLADVWYSFVAQATSHTVTVDPNGSALDAVIVAYSSCGGNQVGCSDTQGGNGTLSTLVLNGLTVGNTYRVRVYDYGTQTTNGGFRICVTHTGGGGTCPDPTITSLTFDPPNPTVGQDVNFDIEITNAGTASTVAADDPRIEYWVNGVYTGDDDDETTVLGPGDSDTEVLSNYVFNAPGIYTVCAILDPYPNECPTNNNTFCQQVTVLPGPVDCVNPQLTPPSVTHSPVAFSTTPGADDVIVDVQPLCEYTITGSCLSAGWFTLDGPSSGTASGVGQFFINYSLDDNTSTSPQSCTLNINGAVFTVTQDGCISEFDSPTSATVPASGGIGDIDVDSYAPCTWSLSYNCPWISLSSSSGSDDATISFTAQPNPDQTQRICIITITGGDTFTITQAGCIPPTVATGSYGPLCSNAGPIILAGSPAGGMWSGTGVNGNQFDPSSGTQTLTYTVIQSGCTGSAQTTIVVSNASTWYEDLDGDGDGDPNSSIEACTQPQGYVGTNTDPCPALANLENGDPCDDSNPNTVNDVVTNCLCTGTLLDDDCEGVPGGPAQPGTACNDSDVCTINDVYDSNCVCAGTFQDADGDSTCDAQDGCPNDPNKIAPGVCGCGVADTDTDGDGLADCVDPCPALANLENGDPCDDGNPNTLNDVVTNCICAGTLLDDDCEGVPGGPAVPGTACDDLSACTTSDLYDTNCNCVGTPVGDSDNDGLCDVIDPCPTLANVEPGDGCDDGDACTTNDQITGSCGCAGTPVGDADSDGLCDLIDPCPTLANVEPGDACDDGDPCTSNDLVNGSCGCVGTPVGDADGDGLCDLIDPCPMLANIEPGDACDDDDPCTNNDLVDANCLCVGVLDNIDTDSDGEPDCSDTCPNVTGQVGSPCDDGQANTVNDSLNTDCDCVGDLTTSVQNVSSTGEWLTIQPNPSSGSFLITPSASTTTPIEIRVFDGLGQLVSAPLYLIGSQPQGLDLQRQADGIYFLRATRGSESHVLELVIQR